MKNSTEPHFKVYDFFIKALFVIARLFSKIDLLEKEYQISDRLYPKVKEFPKDKKSLWCHCPSMGEAKGLAHFLAEDQEFFDSHYFFITCNRISALSYLTDFFADHSNVQVNIAPIDQKDVIARILKVISPSLYLVYESDLWPNQLKWITCPKLLISGKIPPKFRKRLQSASFQKSIFLNPLHTIYSQDRSDQNALLSLNIHSEVTGDFKLLELKKKRQPESIPDKYIDVCLTSIHYNELSSLLPILKSEGKKIVFIPRYPNKIQAIQKSLTEHQISFHSIQKIAEEKTGLFLVEEMGLVDQMLRHSRIAIIGGSFQKIGVHNLWEPLKHHCHIVIGPHFDNQIELVKALKNAELIRILSTPTLDQLPSRELSSTLSNKFIDTQLKSILQKHQKVIQQISSLLQESE